MSAAEQQPAKLRSRVVSLLPSATEMLSLIGAGIVGRSHECDFPEAVRDGVPALTGAHNRFENSAQMHDAVTDSLRSGQGLYWLDSQRLADLRPDAIVTQSLCSVCAVDLDIVRRAAAKVFPTPHIIDTNPMSLQDVIADIRRLGAELGLSERGEAAAAALQARVDRAVKLAAELAAEAPAAASDAPASSPAQRKRVVFLEWTSPLFPGGHWTPQMIHMAGGVCPVNPPRAEGGGAGPSKETDPAEVVAADPDLIIVASCGLDLTTTRREVASLEQLPWWRGLRAVQSGQVVLVDGNQHFNRPGPRLVDALEWLVALLGGRPDLMPPGFPWEWLQPPQLLAVTGRDEAREVAGMRAAAAASAAAAVEAEAGCQERAAWAVTIVLGGPSPALAASAAAPAPANGSAEDGRRRPLTNGTSPTPATGAATLDPGVCDYLSAAAPARAATPMGPPEASTSGTGAAGAAAEWTLAPDAALRRGTEAVGSSQPQGCCGGGCGGGGAAAEAIDPWVAACSPWSTAPHLPADIEDLHAAACESGESSYEDPETGFMVFTQATLAKRGYCCANRCRHCPWGHMRVQGRPRQNRITRPTLLHPSPAALRAWRQREKEQQPCQPDQQANQQSPSPSSSPAASSWIPSPNSPWPKRQQQQQVREQGKSLHPEQLQPARSPKSATGGGAGGMLRSLWSAIGSGGGGGSSSSNSNGNGNGGSHAGSSGSSGVTLLCHEGCKASDAITKVLAEARAGAKDPQGQRLVLLAAFDVDSGALWGPVGAAPASSRGPGAATPSECSGAGGGGAHSRGGGGGGNICGCSGTAREFSIAVLGAVMDASLRHQLDLVAVPMQVSDRSWPHDPLLVQRALAYVVRTSAELLQERSISRVVAVRPEEGTPDLFVQHTAGAVPGGWAEIVRRVNEELAGVRNASC